MQVKDSIIHSKEKRKLFTGIVTYFMERDYKKWKEKKEENCYYGMQKSVNKKQKIYKKGQKK